MGLARSVATCSFVLLSEITPNTGPHPGTWASVLELRMFSYALNPADVRAAREVAQTVLSSADIQVRWRDCGDHDNGCGESVGDYPYIRVHLLPIFRASDASVSGDAVHGPGETPTVLVYVRRNAEVLATMRQNRAARSSPELSTLTIGLLLGLTVAHEVGHVLGLGHSSTGVMKPKLSLEDLIAARRSALAFTDDERERMKRTLEAMGEHFDKLLSATSKQVVSPRTRSV